MRSDLRPSRSAAERGTRGRRRIRNEPSFAGEDELEKLLELAGISSLLTDVTSADDAERSKPDPDVVLAAIRRSGCKPPELVMIGDTSYDVEAARRAGVHILAVRSGGWSDSALEGATDVFDDVEEILHQYDKLFSP